MDLCLNACICMSLCYLIFSLARTHTYIFVFPIILKTLQDIILMLKFVVDFNPIGLLAIKIFLIYFNCIWTDN